jgi:hypothetical protein
MDQLIMEIARFGDLCAGWGKATGDATGSGTSRSFAYDGKMQQCVILTQIDVGKRLEWFTGAIPQPNDTETFVFAGGFTGSGSGGGGGEGSTSFTFLVEHQPLLHFDQVRIATTWHDQAPSSGVVPQVSLRFVPTYVREQEVAGLFFATVTRSLLGAFSAQARRVLDDPCYRLGVEAKGGSVSSKRAFFLNPINIVPVCSALYWPIIKSSMARSLLGVTPLLSAHVELVHDYVHADQWQAAHELVQQLPRQLLVGGFDKLGDGIEELKGPGPMEKHAHGSGHESKNGEVKAGSSPSMSPSVLSASHQPGLPPSPIPPSGHLAGGALDGVVPSGLATPTKDGSPSSASIRVERLEKLNFAGVRGFSYAVRQSSETCTLEWFSDPLTSESLSLHQPLTFVWTGGLGRYSEMAQGFHLLVNGRTILDFEVTREPAVWFGAPAAIPGVSGEQPTAPTNVPVSAATTPSYAHLPRLFYYPTRLPESDGFGFFCITLPPRLLPSTPGEPLRFGVRSRGRGSKRFFALDPVHFAAKVTSKPNWFY